MPSESIPPLPDPFTEDIPDFFVRIVRMSGVLAVTTTAGFFILAPLLAPRRTAGSTRSAHLEWQRRQAEIQCAMEREGKAKAVHSPSGGRADHQSAP